MRPPALRFRPRRTAPDRASPRSRRVALRLAAALGALLTVAVPAAAPQAAAAPAAADSGRVHREDRFLTVPESSGPGPGTRRVRLDTSFYTAGRAGRRPAVLLAHGFGSDEDAVRDQARSLARAGYAVLTWSARGFGRSGGRIGLDDPDREIADVSRLLDWLSGRPEVLLDGPGDPRAGMAGASYGGAAALLAAAYDRRIDAIAPQLTWWDLRQALFPQNGPGAPRTGVFKKLWAGIFFASGRPAGSAAGRGGTHRVDPVCGRFAADVCAAYRRSAVTGRPDAATLALLARSSPSAVGGRIRVPTLLVQGRTDALFPLDQADRAARAVRRNGAPVAVDWVAGGHDGGDREDDRVRARVRNWFDRYLRRDRSADTGPAFRVSRGVGTDSSRRGAAPRSASTDRYPGLRGTAHRDVALAGRPQTVVNPPGGQPPGISSIPGLGGLSGLGAALQSGGTPGGDPSGPGSADGGAAASGPGGLPEFPGQSARFTSAPLRTSVRVTGAPEVRVTVSADRSGRAPEHGAAGRTGLPDAGAVLIAELDDVAPDGSSTLPSGLAAPVRVTPGEAGRAVRVRLPAVDHLVPAGHRLRLKLSTTDLGYATPARPAAFRVAAAPGGMLRMPTVNALRGSAPPPPWWTWGLPAGAAALAAALLLTARPRRGAAPYDQALADVPLRITGLGKRYRRSADRWAVRDLSFGAEPGRVVGLLGPNGAGKTTTLRMLMGLIRPDEGTVRVFGHAIGPGTPVLSRVGAFVEGAGFLPHLTGRANLELYWRATGRPAADAHLAEALEVADLGAAVERPVRTYSQGMRQRLAIAQAMLGLPDLLILDEPTNGLDPPQIREMRGVLTRYASAGRTVIVSSHLLSEVEQTCTDVVVMEAGRLVAAGPVEEVAGADGTLLVGTAEPVGPATVRRVAALPGVRAAEPADGGLLVRPGAELTTAGLLSELLRLGVPVERIGPHRRLEEAFLALIGGGS